MPDFWVLIVIAAVISMAVRGAQRVRLRAAREQWADAARELGFAMKGTNLRNLAVRGSEGKLQVSVQVVQSDNSTTTRYRVELPPLGFKLGLTRQAEWHQFVKAFGAQDLEIGDPDFDERFMVKTSNPDRVRAYLNPTRVAALKTLATKHSGVSLTDNQLQTSTGGVEKDADRIVSTVRDLSGTAAVLRPDAQPASPQDEVVPPLPVDISDDEQPERDDELQRIIDTIEEYNEEEAAAEHDVAPAPGAPAVADADAAFTAARLFGERQLGFEVERRFDDEYRGSAVDWTGTVQRPAGLSAARKFNGDDHTIVEINVATIEDDLYGSSSVDAVVAFPPGTTLPERGEPVRFSGTLIDIDALTKDLYVVEGRLG